MKHRHVIRIAAVGMVLGSRLVAKAVTVAVSSPAGTPGQTVEFVVTLTTDAYEVAAGVETDLRFDPLHAPIAATADGRPDCSANPAIGKGATAFAFRPIGCDPRRRECTGMHALVVAVDNVDPIPSGATLYICRVTISQQARSGRYPIMVSDGLYAPPSGGDRVARGIDGVVTVLDTTVTPVPTGRPASPPVINGGGCQVDARGSSAPLWLALVGAMWRRRRSGATA